MPLNSCEFLLFMKQSEPRAKLLEEIQSFTQLVGHRIYGQTDVDIVQVALQYSNFTSLSFEARAIAHQEPNRLYLDWRYEGNKIKMVYFEYNSGLDLDR